MAARTEDKSTHAGIYSRLLPGRIRLITVLDDSGFKYGLDVVKLDNAPEYGALSYTWQMPTEQADGSSNEGYEIRINGVRFPVSRNLYDALNWCETRIHSIGQRFWIDQICINQQDLDENASQVSLMRSIYEKSYYIYAWLGVPRDRRNAELGVDLMKELDRAYTTALQSTAWMDLEAQMTPGSLGFPTATDTELVAAWDGIADMFGRSYWSRAWVYQEATTPVQVYWICGPVAFRHSELHRTLRYASRFCQFDEFPQKYRFGGSGGTAQVESIVVARGNRVSNGTEYWTQTLVNMLEKARYTKCSDPRDKVYALVSLASDLEAGEVVVDYRKDLFEVYGDVFRYALRTRQDLRILGSACSSDPTSRHPWLRETLHPELPSWLPDWRRRASPAEFARSPTYATHEKLYSASGRSTRRVSIRARELQIEGLTSDLIQIVLEAWDKHPDGYKRMIRRWQSALTDLELLSHQSALQCAMAADTDLCLVPTTEARSKTEADPRRWDVKRGGGLDCDLIMSDAIGLGVEDRSRRAQMIVNMYGRCYGRRIGITRHGRLGLFPAAVREGDRVVTLCGDDLPHILRSVTGHEQRYTYVGECFVDGLMDGEAVEAAHTEHRSFESLILI